MDIIRSKILSQSELHERRRKQCLETFKKFKRFLKDNGQYHNVMTYLFPNDRRFYEFIESWIEEGCAKDLLNRVSILGPTYKERGYGYWLSRIAKVAEDWNRECYSLFGEMI